MVVQSAIDTIEYYDTEINYNTYMTILFTRDQVNFPISINMSNESSCAGAGAGTTNDVDDDSCSLDNNDKKKDDECDGGSEEDNLELLKASLNRCREKIENDEFDLCEEEDLLPLCKILTSPEYSDSSYASSRVDIIQFVNVLLIEGSAGNEEVFTQAELIEQAIVQRDESILLSSILPENLFKFWKRLISIIINSIDTQNVEKKLNKTTSFAIGPDNIAIAGDYAAEKIYGGATFLSKCLSDIVPKVTDGIENLGTFAKNNLEPHSPDDLTEKEVGLHENKTYYDNGIRVTEENAVAFSQASVEATDVFRSSAKAVTSGICDISSKGLNKLGEKWEENEVGKTLCPEKDELRESVAAIGKVCFRTRRECF